MDRNDMIQNLLRGCLIVREISPNPKRTILINKTRTIVADIHYVITC